MKGKVAKIRKQDLTPMRRFRQQNSNDMNKRQENFGMKTANNCPTDAVR